MKKIAQLSILISLYLSIFLPRPAYGQFPEEWKNLNGECVVFDVATIQGVECLFTNIVRVLIPFAGLALFIMLIVGGFQFISAGGEPKALQKARATITYAIVGLVVFFGIWFILLLIKTITGVDVTQFVVPGP